MIVGPRKYSKDPTLVPEGIALTLPKVFFEDRWTTPERFDKMFYRYMQREDSLWNFRLTNLPTLEKLQSVYLVYIIWDGQLRYKCNFVQIERNVSKSFHDAPDGKSRAFPAANWVLFTGPAEKPPFVWEQPGFQGFRYTTKLF